VEFSHAVSAHVTLPFFFVQSYIHATGDVGKFEALRRVASTGAVLTAPQFEWAQRAFNDHVILCSGSGGTDIFGACVCPHFTFIFPPHITDM
jgi:acyl-coenzyme A synthetase/AMP-(fatty) acid ligase